MHGMRYLIGRFYVWLVGWRIEGQKPDVAKYVLIAAPHTSNWDFPIMLAMSWVLGMRVNWMGKHTLFRFPFGPLMRWLGGVSVDRRSRHNTVQQIVNEFARRDDLVLLVPPEGTRRRADYWKSGFYYMALGAGVPLVFGFLDYRRKVGGIGPTYYPTGDVERDLEVIRRFYEPIGPKYPDCYGPIRFRPRNDQPAASTDQPGTTSDQTEPTSNQPAANQHPSPSPGVRCASSTNPAASGDDQPAASGNDHPTSSCDSPGKQ